MSFRHALEERIEEERMCSWPVWSCDVTVTPELGPPVRFKAGDRVVFADGMRCVWEVHDPVRKHYRFG